MGNINNDSRVFLKVYYGIKAFNSDGSERPYDSYSDGVLYENIDDAIKAQERLFDAQCNELRCRQWYAYDPYDLNHWV